MMPSAIGLVVKTEPSVEPVSLSEAKLHLRVDTDADDDLIERLITVARRESEKIARRSLITQTLSLTLDGWPAPVFTLPRPPVQSIVAITYTESNGDEITLDSDVYAFDAATGRVFLESGQSWPAVELRPYASVNVEYVAGYGDAATDVPAEYKQAILLLVGHYHENREAVVVGAGFTATALPLAVRSLLTSDRGSW